MKVVPLLPVVTGERFRIVRKLENNFARQQKTIFRGKHAVMTIYITYQFHSENGFDQYFSISLCSTLLCSL